MESLIVNSIPSLSDIASTNYLLVLKSVDKGVSIAAEKLLERYKTRNITYLRNLAIQFERVISIHQDMERIFRSKLSDKNIEIFGSLRAYQRDYLFKLTQQPKEKENVPKVSEEDNKPQSNEAFKNAPSAVNHTPYSIADELSKLAELRNQGIISDGEFIQLKQDAIRKSIGKASQ